MDTLIGDAVLAETDAAVFMQGKDYDNSRECSIGGLTLFGPELKFTIHDAAFLAARDGAAGEK
jgi:hypothetical protein